MQESQVKVVSTLKDLIKVLKFDELIPRLIDPEVSIQTKVAMVRRGLNRAKRMAKDSGYPPSKRKDFGWSVLSEAIEASGKVDEIKEVLSEIRSYRQQQTTRKLTAISKLKPGASIFITYRRRECRAKFRGFDQDNGTFEYELHGKFYNCSVQRFLGLTPNKVS